MMFFRRLSSHKTTGSQHAQEPEWAALYWLRASRANLIGNAKLTTLEVKEHQPTVACSVRRRGSLASCSGNSQPGTRLILHALQPVSSADSPLAHHRLSRALSRLPAAVLAAVATNRTACTATLCYLVVVLLVRCCSACTSSSSVRNASNCGSRLARGDY
jgi:hypothetical protein